MIDWGWTLFIALQVSLLLSIVGFKNSTDQKQKYHNQFRILGLLSMF